jgi:hypothetical protein
MEDEIRLPQAEQKAWSMPIRSARIQGQLLEWSGGQRPPRLPGFRSAGRIALHVLKSSHSASNNRFPLMVFSETALGKLRGEAIPTENDSSSVDCSRFSRSVESICAGRGVREVIGQGFAPFRKRKLHGGIDIRIRFNQLAESIGDNWSHVGQVEMIVLVNWLAPSTIQI